MRQLASIQRIVALEPIPNADAIEKATVLGWELVVAKKDNFKVGDLVVYIEVDSILPERPEFEFLRDRKFRIKTIKLRGQISQGIAFPLSILPKGNYEEGDDVTLGLGIVKYDPQAKFEREEADRQAQVYKNRFDKFLKRYSWYRQLVYRPNRLPFPKFIPKTDETRIQNIPWVCNDGTKLYQVTEKLDGQSFTAFVIPNPVTWQFWKPYVFGVCSRNFQLLKENDTTYWRIAKRYDLKKRMINLAKSSYLYRDGFYIQGEIIGPNIQGNKYRLSEVDLYLYQAAFVGADIQRYNPYMLMAVCERLELKQVPTLYQTTVFPTVPEMVANSTGLSVIHPTTREGLVWKNAGGTSFKVINPDFLLKEDAA